VGGTTVLIRSTWLNNASAARRCSTTAVAAVALPPASLLLGEPGIVAVTPIALASLFYQGAVISFASYLIWFWLLTRYLAARLSVFSFLSPLFGVAASVTVLSEPLRPAFVGAVALVGAGIYLVNGRRRSRRTCMRCNHLCHASRELAGVGEVQQFIATVRVRSWPQQAGDEELRRREMPAQHRHERNRAAFAHQRGGAVKVRHRGRLQRLLEPARGRRGAPAGRGLIGLEAHARTLWRVGLQ
jgi:hypothetical protein